MEPKPSNPTSPPRSPSRAQVSRPWPPASYPKPRPPEVAIPIPQPIKSPHPSYHFIAMNKRNRQLAKERHAYLLELYRKCMTHNIFVNLFYMVFLVVVFNAQHPPFDENIFLFGALGFVMSFRTVYAVWFGSVISRISRLDIESIPRLKTLEKTIVKVAVVMFVQENMVFEWDFIVFGEKTFWFNCMMMSIAQFVFNLAATWSMRSITGRFLYKLEQSLAINQEFKNPRN